MLCEYSKFWFDLKPIQLFKIFKYLLSPISWRTTDVGTDNRISACWHAMHAPVYGMCLISATAIISMLNSLTNVQYMHNQTIHHWGPSLSSCRCSHLKQFTPACHFCTFVACLSVTPQDSSLHHFLSQSVIMNSACAVTLVISDTLIVHVSVTYLLTYLPSPGKSITRRHCPAQ